jgi:hypothetical protein
MRRSRLALPIGAKVGLLALGACTAWLVIQNTVLMVTMLSSNPPVAGRVAVAMVKAGALVAARFWASPVAAALAAVTLIALLLRARPGEARPEARHG